MFTKTKIALAAVAVLGFAGASAVQANDSDSGGYHGGYVMPGGMDGVNPAYHLDWFPNHANGSKAYGYANRGKAHGYTNGGSAYGYANGGKAVGYPNGQFINGNFIPRGTSPAQVPAFHEED